MSPLQTAMSNRGAERQSLRGELQAAQEQLEMLKAIQRQMMAQQDTAPLSPSSHSTTQPDSRPQSFLSEASSISEGGDDLDTPVEGSHLLY